jgi:hypothetical protein
MLGVQRTLYSRVTAPCGSLHGCPSCELALRHIPPSLRTTCCRCGSQGLTVSHQVLAPRASRSIRANIKVSSTETGIIFGNIIYEQVCAVAAIHIGGSSTPPMPKPAVAPLVTSRIAHIRGPVRQPSALVSTRLPCVC